MAKIGVVVICANEQKYEKGVPVVALQQQRASSLTSATLGVLDTGAVWTDAQTLEHQLQPYHQNTHFAQRSRRLASPRFFFVVRTQNGLQMNSAEIKGTLIVEIKSS